MYLGQNCRLSKQLGRYKAAAGQAPAEPSWPAGLRAPLPQLLLSTKLKTAAKLRSVRGRADHSTPSPQPPAAVGLSCPGTATTPEPPHSRNLSDVFHAAAADASKLVLNTSFRGAGVAAAKPHLGRSTVAAQGKAARRAGYVAVPNGLSCSAPLRVGRQQSHESVLAAAARSCAKTGRQPELRALNLQSLAAKPRRSEVLPQSTGTRASCLLSALQLCLTTLLLETS